MKKILAHFPMKLKYLVTAFLAILLIAGLIPVGVNLFAKADVITHDSHSTALSEDQVVLNGGSAMTLGQQVTAPQDIRAGQWVTYAYDAHTYAFQPQFPIAAGEKLTLTAEGTIQLNREGNAPTGAVNIETIATKSTASGQGIFTLKSDALMEANKLYYYDDGTSCYTFSTPKDLGYKAATNVDRYGTLGDASLIDKPNAKGQSEDGTGTIQIVLNLEDNADTGTANFSGNQFTKHYIFERSSSFDYGKVYLIGKPTYILNGYRQTSVVTQSNLSGTGTATSTYAQETNGADAAMWDMDSNGVIAEPSAYHANYIDMADLTGEQYVASEVRAQAGTTNDWNAVALTIISLPISNVTDGIYFQGVNSGKTAYVDAKAFGNAYDPSWTAENQKNMTFGTYENQQVAVTILGIGGTLARNNGQVWKYANNVLYNNNSMAGISLQTLTQGGNRYLVVNSTDLSATTSDSSASKVYPYQLKLGYKQETATLDEDIMLVKQSKNTTDFTATRMEKVDVTVNYNGVKAATTAFDISYRLVDEEGNRVSGTFGELTFDSNGNATKSGVTNGMTFNLGWIPNGYKLTTRSVVATDTTDADRMNYQVAVTENGNAWAVGSALTIGDDTEALVYNIDDPLRTVTIGLTHDGSGSYKNKTFKVLPIIYERNGTTLFTGTLYNRTTDTNIVFENGVPKADYEYLFTLANGRSITLEGVPNGYHVMLHTEMQYKDITIVSTSEGDLGATKDQLYGADTATGSFDSTSGTHVDNWYVTKIRVDNNEDFLTNIHFENITATMNLVVNNGGGNRYVWWDPINLTFEIQEQQTDGNWVTTNTLTQTVATNQKANVEGTDYPIFKYKYDNTIPPGARVKVTASATATQYMDSYYDGAANNSVGSISLKLNGTSVIGGSYSYGNNKKVLNSSEYYFNPENDETYNFQLIIANNTYVTYQTSTSLISGDPTISIPVHLTGFANSAVLSNGQGGNPGKLVTDNTLVNVDDASYIVDYTDVQGTVNTTQYYALGSSAPVYEIKHNSSDMLLSGNDTFTVGFISGTTGANHAVYLSPFIKTNDTNSNGAPLNTIGSELTEVPGYKLVAINFTHSNYKTLNGNKVYYEQVKQAANEQGKIEVVLDIIPQDVVISMKAGSATGKDYTNKNKYFTVDFTLLNSTTSAPVYDQIYAYTYTKADGSEETGYIRFDAEDGAEIVNVTFEDHGTYKTIASYTSTGKKPTMKAEESYTLKLPYHYTVVANEEDTANYTVAYRSKASNADWQEGSRRVRIEGVNEGTSYIDITNTRNNVEDDIGLFGGRVNRVFLAIVGAISLAAAAAYIYGKKDEFSEE